jgi:Zn ribbon nucleic-acid-binding protein
MKANPNDPSYGICPECYSNNTLVCERNDFYPLRRLCLTCGYEEEAENTDIAQVMWKPSVDWPPRKPIAPCIDPPESFVKDQEDRERSEGNRSP